MKKKDKDMEKYDEIASDFKYWNTRVIRHHVVWHFESGDTADEYYYGIHEVYYNEKNEPTAWTGKEMRMYFDNSNDLSTKIKQIREALERTVLELDNIDGEDGDLVDSGKLLSDFKEEDEDESL